MNYKGKNLETFNEIFNYALNLARTNEKEVNEFFQAYIEYIYNNADDINSLEEAEDRAKRNFGYFSGYYDRETEELVDRVFQTVHPIFGCNSHDISAEDAYKMGLEQGKRD